MSFLYCAPGGGLKTAATNQDSRELSMKWREACRFAVRIEEALREKLIVVNKNGYLESTDGSDDIIL